MLALALAFTLVAQAPQPATTADKPTVRVHDLDARGIDTAGARFLTSEICRTMSEPGTLQVLATNLRTLAALEGDAELWSFGAL